VSGLADWNAGERLLLGRYRLGSRIGGGGMAEVYEGEDTRTGRSVAVKIALPYLAGDPSFGARLRQEAQIVSHLDHPGIARLYDAGEENGRPFLVMEMVRGPNLRAVLERSGPMPLGRTLDIVTEVLSALQYSHERGVLHRDVKLENVLLTPEGRAKLVDFGIARAGAESSVTAPGLVVGSPHYLAPERLTGSPASASSEVYSVGVLLFRMLTGRLPFEGDTPSVVHARQVLWHPKSVAELRPGLPAWVDGIVGRALAPDPDRRFRSAEEMRREIGRLGAVVEGEATVQLPAVPVSAGRRPGRVRALSRGLRMPRIAYALLAGLALLMAGLLVSANARDGASDSASPPLAAPVAAQAPFVAPTVEPTRAPTATPASPTSTPAPRAVPERESAGTTAEPSPRTIAPTGDNHPQGGPPGQRNKPDKSDKKKRN
jgi:serine/threonine-protein kinase